MPSNISDLCKKVLASIEFRETYKKIEYVAAQKRIANKLQLPGPEVCQMILLQASLLALSDNEEHKRISQKIIALIYELYGDMQEFNYAAQIITARLGNFPVVSEESQVFDRWNLFNSFSGKSRSDFIFDPELVSDYLREEVSSRVEIKDIPYHFNIYQRELLSYLDSKSLVSFSAPTSFGKSFIVRHHIGQLFANGQLGRCLILVPTKALIDNFLEDLIALRIKLRLNYSIITHARLAEDAPESCILILTQERLSFLIDQQPEIIKTIKLIFCDEAQYIAYGYRGFLLRSVLKKIINICGVNGDNNSKTKYIFSSPIIENPEYYKQRFFPHLSNDDVFHGKISYNPVEKNIYIIEKTDEKYQYYLFGDVFETTTFKNRLVKIGGPINIKRNDKDAENDNNIYEDVSIVTKSNIKGRAILFTTGPIMAHKYGIHLAESLPDNDKLSKSEIHGLDRYIEDHYDKVFGIIELIKKGIGLHYGPMPIGLRRAIVDLFEEGKIDYLICTKTLLEGVNLPAKSMYIFSDKQWGNKPHTPLSFWNLAGRAGRITYGLSGNVFCIGKKQDSYKTLLEKSADTIEDPEKQSLETKTRRDRLVETLTEDGNINYIKSEIRDDIEYLVFELLTSKNPEYLLRNRGLDEEVMPLILSSIERIKSQLTIPYELMMKNPGIDPRFQNDLYLSLSSPDGKKGIGTYFELISSVHNLNGDKIHEILTVTSKILHWPQDRYLPDQYETDSITIISRRIAQWINELQLNGFIGQRLRYIETGSDYKSWLKRIKAAKNVISDIEEEISFAAPKYVKCFYDIALDIIQESSDDMDTLTDKVDAFLFALEAGVKSNVGRFLCEMGLSRSIAIKVNSLIGDKIKGQICNKEVILNMENQQILLEGLSPIAFKELKDHLE